MVDVREQKSFFFFNMQVHVVIISNKTNNNMQTTLFKTPVCREALFACFSFLFFPVIDSRPLPTNLLVAKKKKKNGKNFEKYQKFFCVRVKFSSSRSCGETQLKSGGENCAVT